MKSDGQMRTNRRNGITRRQSEILRFIADGQTDKEIAAQLGISEETVGHHLRVLYGHEGVHCRAALIAKLAVRLEH